jgi:putative copper resistance protein D
MNLNLLMAVHWLHILGGMVWFGGYAFMTFAVWPALLSRPPEDAKAIYELIGKGAGPLMAISGNLVFWLGIVRGTWLGPIDSFHAVVSTPYGLTWLVALIVTMGLMIHGGIASRKLPELIWGKKISPEAARARVRIDSLFSVSGFLIVLICMVLMRFGL